jgi:hypothetical protein
MAESFKTIHEHILEYKLKDLASKPAETLQKKMRDMAKIPPASAAEVMARALRTNIPIPVSRAASVATVLPRPVLPVPPLADISRRLQPLGGPSQAELTSRVIRANYDKSPDIATQLKIAEKDVLRARGKPVYLTWMTPQFEGMLARLLHPGGTTAKGGSVSDEDVKERRRSNILVRGFSAVFDQLHKSMMSWWGQIKGYALGPVFEMIYQSLMPLLNPVQDFLLTIVKGALYPLAQTVGPKVQNFFMTLSKMALPGAVSAGKTLGVWISNFIDWLREGLPSAMKVASTYAAHAMKWIRTAAVWLFDKSIEVYTWVRNVAIPYIENVLIPKTKEIYTKLEPVFTFILDHIGSISAVIAGVMVVGGPGVILDAAKGVMMFGQALSTFQLSQQMSQLTMAMGGTANATQGLIGKWAGPTGLVVAAGAAGYAIGAWADKTLGISEKFGKWLGDVFTPAVSADVKANIARGEEAKRLRHLPQPAVVATPLQEGGYVQQTGLALVHGGETVFPSVAGGSVSQKMTDQLSKSNDLLYYGFVHTVQRLDSLIAQRSSTVIDQVLVLGV